MVFDLFCGKGIENSKWDDLAAGQMTLILSECLSKLEV
jgi:hypothetical protein